VSPDSVVILTTEAELDTLEYARVAIIEATGSGEYTNQTDMLNAMRKRAGEIGANAILLPQINEPGAGAKVAAAIFGGSSLFWVDEVVVARARGGECPEVAVMLMQSCRTPGVYEGRSAAGAEATLRNTTNAARAQGGGWGGGLGL